MLALHIFFAFSVAVGYAGLPPPQPTPPLPPDPSQPPPGCQPDDDCVTAYQTAVLGDNPCQAAQTFKTCAEAAQSICSESIPSIVQAMTSAAQDAVAEKCNVISENLPACADICVPYEEKAIADWADNKENDGCQQYQLYRTCLQNFNDSSDANCKVTHILSQVIITHNTQCPRTCTEYYDECRLNLPKLAADETKVQETCLLWSFCKAYDFSKCAQSLTVNYDTKCNNGTSSLPVNNGTSNLPIKNENGTPVLTSSLGMVVGTIGVLILLIR